MAMTKKTQKIISDVEKIQDYVGKELNSTEEVEQAIEQIVKEEAAKVAKPKRAAKSEVVKTKADTIDGEDKKTIAGKPQILDAAKVQEIIRLSDQGSTPSALAKQFGVAPSHTAT